MLPIIATITATVIAAAMGLWLGSYTKSKPHLYTRCLVIGLLSTTPLMIGYFTWYDEVFLGFFLLSNMPKLTIGNHKLHSILFVTFASYMILACFHGMLVLGSVRKIRWPIFFLILLLLLYKINNKKEKPMLDEGLAYAITVFGLFFSLVFISYGIVTEAVGFDRSDIQAAMLGYGWTNIWWAIWPHFSYTTFIFIVTMPAVLMTLYDTKIKRRLVAWITFVLLIFITYYYDVRIAALYLIGSLLLLIPRLKIVQFLTMIVLIVVIALCVNLNSSVNRGLDIFFSDLSQTAGSMWTKDADDPRASRDIDRKVWLFAIYPALTDNLLNFFIGYGFRTAGHVIAPYVDDLLILYGKEPVGADDVGSEAITNIAVETGVIGIALFFSLFIMAGRAVYLCKGNFRWIFIFSILTTIAWLFVTNIIDVVILYYILMPAGIFTQLSRLSVNRKKQKEHNIFYPGKVEKITLQ